MNEILDMMGDSIGLIRIAKENFANKLITEKEFFAIIDNSLDILFDLQKQIGKENQNVG